MKKFLVVICILSLFKISEARRVRFLEGSLWETLEFLTQSPRPAGSDRIMEVRRRLVSLLSSWGCNVKLEKFPFTGWKLLKAPKLKILSPNQEKTECLPVYWSGSTGGKEIKGKLKLAGEIKTLEVYDWTRFGVVDSEGKTIAYIIGREDTILAQPLDHPTDIPYIMVEPKTFKKMKGWLNQGKEVEVSLSVDSQFMPGLEIANIIASRSERWNGVIVSAHYDSFFNSPGAHDNASGTVALLGIVKRMSEGENPNRFIFFDAEEPNKYGSYSYVRRLQENGKLKDVKLIINIDAVGVGKELYLFTSPQIKKKIEEIVSKSKVAEEIPVNVVAEESLPQFDAWPFMQKGIPVVQIGTRENPSITSLSESQRAIFHSPGDTLKNIQPQIIEYVISLVTELLKNYK
jgi:hypothetical protein